MGNYIALSIPRMGDVVSLPINNNEPMKNTKDKSFTLPQGVYYIGDPSYVLSNEDYKTLLNENDLLLKTEVVTFKGKELFILGDGLGDGQYEITDICDDEDEQWSTFISVDSGCWGVIPVELLINDETSEDDLYKSGMLIDSTDIEDENGPVNSFDVDVTYEDNFPVSVDIMYYKVNTKDG